MERPEPSSIPTTPGVYLYKDAQNRIVYVGKARNLRKRILSYFRADVPRKTTAMLSHAVRLETLSTGTEKEALLLEASLIKRHRPHYNIVLRDDKQYVLFRISRREAFPRLEVVRQAKKDGARYFGPFTSAQAARETWKMLHRAFPLRRCSDRAFKNRVRPCLYHHIGQCLAPCVLEVSREEYGALLQRVELFLAGRSRELVQQLEEGMLAASEALDFERAALLRDQIRAVESTVERQSVVLPEGGDMDVVGIVPVKDGLGLGLLFVREGKLMDGRTYFWSGLTLEDAPELVWTFLAQYYGGLTGGLSGAVPPRIIVPFSETVAEQAVETDGPDSAEDPEGTAGEDPESPGFREPLEAALSEVRQGAVRILLPRGPAESRLVDMAASNAREAALRREEQPLAQRLAVALQAGRPLERIECVDVSHTGGQETRVGLVAFEHGKPFKVGYRTYSVDAGGDDYAALYAFALRRAAAGVDGGSSGEILPWPDLLLVDGGRGQLASIMRGFQERLGGNVPFLVAGIAKARDEDGHADRRAGNVSDRIFLYGRSNPLPLRSGSAELLFLQHVRDTAHAHVIGRHRKARAKAALSGELHRIPGVGPATEKMLWTHFPNLDAILAASEADLAAVPGLGPRRAAKLYEKLKTLR